MILANRKKTGYDEQRENGLSRIKRERILTNGKKADYEGREENEL